MTRLGINIDHVATLRQQRRERDPDPIQAARICVQAGADSIVCHLREDRRHIQDADVRKLRHAVKTSLNLEMSIHPQIVKIAARIKPDLVTLVPERRQELTTEGGLNVEKHFSRVQHVVDFLQGRGIKVSLFIAPEENQIKKASLTGAKIIELHTGCYANATTPRQIKVELNQLRDMAEFAKNLGFSVSAGHGLKYHNTAAIARIPQIEELNIGHSIISRALLVGLARAVKDMKRILR